MSIKYTYEIINVDESSRCMEVVYSSNNRQTLHIGTRLPYEGESVEEVIRAYAPVAYWEEKERRVVLPSTGFSGEVDTAPVTPPPPPEPAKYDGYFADKLAVESFLASKGVNKESEYVVTMYNVSTKQLLANLFNCDGQLVKALNGTVTEWYEEGVKIGATKYAYVSKDLTNGRVLDRYSFDQRGLVKVAPEALEPTITRFGGFESVPPAMKVLLRNFEYKNKVTAWSLKSDGLVVEFSY
jgi:hypothetical protein